jgi:gas vesicle protein
MESNSKKRYYIGAGLLAGFALGYYLNSKEGRAWREQAATTLDEYGNELGGIASELGTLANNYAGEARNKGQEIVNDARHRGEDLTDQAKQSVATGKSWVNEKAETLKTAVSQTKEDATDAFASVESGFKKGVNQAKAKMNSITKG